MATAAHPSLNGAGSTAASALAGVRRRRLTLVVVAAVLALGASALNIPFMGDQALFTLGGRALAEGKTLYTQFWDMKQPAVFVFYRAAGGLFGYSEFGVHLLELLWQLALVAVVLRVVRGRFENEWLEPLAALFSVGFYYAIVTMQEMTQVEALVGLPILVSIWLYNDTLERGAGRANWRPVGVGLALFTVAGFKLVLVAVPIACLIVIARRRDGAGVPASRPRVIRWALLGAGAPAALFLVWAIASGAFVEILRTWFQVPLGVPERAGRSTVDLSRAVTTFVKLFAPMLLLAGVGAIRAFGRRRDVIARCMVVWVVVGTAAYLAQLWWFYLLMLFVVPLGLLAAYGLDTLWSRRAQLRLGTMVALAVVLVSSSAFSAERFARRGLHLARHGFALGEANARAFRFDESRRYAVIYRDAKYLRALPADDSVVAWGDPLYLYLGGREQATAMNGWAPEHLDQRLWRRAATELAAARPTVVFVDDGSARFIETRGTGVARILHADYAPVHRSTEGTWYRLVH